MALADLYDAFAQVHLKQAKPYPRPTAPTRGGRTVGKGTALTKAEFESRWAAIVAANK